MKFALFIAAVSAVKINDAPPYFNEPTWNENMPSAAGLLEVSACFKAGGIPDVSCGPTNIELFATGMNGDEDLGQDITMKGQKFHYQEMAQWGSVPVCNFSYPDGNQNCSHPNNSWSLAQAEPAGDGAKKGEDVPPPEKVSVLDGNGTWRVAKGHTTFYGQAD